MSYMYSICCEPLFFEKPLVKNAFFSNPFPKMNVKNPDLDLIRRSHPECGFYEFMIRFWICPPPLPPPQQKTKKNANPGLDFPKKTHKRHFRCVRLGNLDLDFKIQISDFQSNAKSENGFQSWDICFWISIFTVRLANPKKDVLEQRSCTRTHN